MISDLDRTIEQLFIAEFGSPLPFDLSYAVPDKSFAPISTSKNTLNCYLYDIRENRELRSVEPAFRRNSDGTIEKEVAPTRIKASYCITAWSAAQVTPGIVPAIDEHLLLSNVLLVLLKYPTLPSETLVGSLAEQEFPLPTTVISPNSSMASRDFWNAIGGQLRPSLDYSVTISLASPFSFAGRMVTTVRVGYGSGEEFIGIGGTVLDSSTPPQGVASAWVRVQETGQTYVTDGEGHFLIDRMASGTYTLVVRAVGFQEGRRSVRVPQPDGLYDLHLNPL